MTVTKAIIVAFAAASSLVSADNAVAASFDCAKATSRIDHIICGNVSLSMLDGQLAAAYAGALDRSLHKDDLARKQGVWLRQRDDCADEQCLTGAYNRQITLLSEVSDQPGTCSDGIKTDIDVCENEYVRRAQTELDRYLEAVRKRIAGYTYASELGARQTRTAFDASQTAWEAYRKAACEAVSESWSGGGGTNWTYENCWKTMTKFRTDYVWNTWLTFEDDTPPLMPKPSDR